LIIIAISGDGGAFRRHLQLGTGLGNAAAVDGPTDHLPPARRVGPDPRGLFPRDDPLPGAYELYLPGDDVTIWYAVIEHESQDVTNVQHVSADS
jgi:hypothetical protein